MSGNPGHPSEEDLVLFFYGDADAGSTIAAHVEACGTCRASLQEIERTLAAVDRYPVPERGAAYGAEVWARLQPQIEKHAARRWSLSWLAPRRLALAGALAVLLIGAFVAGRYSRQQPQLQQAARQPQAATTVPVKGGSLTQVRDRVLLVAAGEHLERSQMVLIELMNQLVDGPVDISETQAWARDLVPTNRLIRQTADEAGEPVMSDVLDDLERFLVEISNSPSHLSRAEFEQVRQRIDDQGLVFKVRVLDSQVREREGVPTRSKS